MWWESTSDELEKYQQNPEYTKIQKNSHIRKNPSYNVSFAPDLPYLRATGMSSFSGLPKIAIIREEGSNGDREMTSAFYMAGFDTWDVTMTDLLNGYANLDDFRGAVFVGGFSYADVLDSAKGWAGIIKFNPKLADMFNRFYRRENTFSLGVCNGCQLLSLLGWVPGNVILYENQPRFISNPSGRFESRWVTVKIRKNPSIMLSDMEESVLGIWVSHREGHLHFPDTKILDTIVKNNLAPVAYVDEDNIPTGKYPYNPNSSPLGITALCSVDGRHLAMMPHPERAFLMWQWPWKPDGFYTSHTASNNSGDNDNVTKCPQGEIQEEIKPSPWLQMFINARKWCEITR
jgi:phosphoribosylformylglycinamidine synthase